MVQHDLTPVQMASGLKPPASKNTTDPQNQSRCVEREHRETPPTLKHRHEEVSQALAQVHSETSYKFDAILAMLKQQQSEQQTPSL